MSRVDVVAYYVYFNSYSAGVDFSRQNQSM